MTGLKPLKTVINPPLEIGDRVIILTVEKSYESVYKAAIGIEGIFEYIDDDGWPVIGGFGTSSYAINPKTDTYIKV
jgi:hypothetical protein